MLRKLNCSSGHRRALLANLASSLIERESIQTTRARAKETQRLVEKMITKARKGDLNSRRQVLKTLTRKSVVNKLFDDIGPRFEDRPGGYTRILKLGQRRGDGAEMVLLEFVE